MDPSSIPPAQPQPQPVATPPPPPPVQAPLQTAKPLAALSLKHVVIGLFTLVVVSGLTFYTGWRLGYNTGTNQSQNDNQNPYNCQISCGISEKPVIYLYPQQTESVQVRLDYPAGFLATTPTYNPATGWQVQASPGGRLIDLADNQTYPYLFWEGKPAPIDYDMSTGFVVAGNQTKAFLSRELPAIGLSPSETAAFIAFWQPRMSGNPYNLIHFAGREYTDYAKLTITPQPDSELRVFMAFRPLAKPVRVTPQHFTGFARRGFSAVEWGGTELKS